MATTSIYKLGFRFNVFLEDNIPATAQDQSTPTRFRFTKAEIEYGDFKEKLKQSAIQCGAILSDGELDSIVLQGENAVQLWNKEIAEVESSLQDMYEQGEATKTAKNDLLRTANSVFEKMAISDITFFCGSECAKTASRFSWQTRLFGGIVKKIDKQFTNQTTRKNALAVMENLKDFCDLANLVRDDVELRVRNKNTDKFSGQQKYRTWNMLTKNTTDSINKIINSVKDDLEQHKSRQIDAVMAMADHITMHFGKDSVTSEEEKRSIRDNYSLKGVTIGTYINLSRAAAEASVNTVINDELEKIREICMRHFYDLKIESCEPVVFRTDGYHFDGKWTLYLEDGKKQDFSFKATYAGGHNIQRFHMRIRSNLSESYS